MPSEKAQWFYIMALRRFNLYKPNFDLEKDEKQKSKLFRKKVPEINI